MIVITLRDIVGLVLVGAFLLIVLVVLLLYIWGKIEDWRNRK